MNGIFSIKIYLIFVLIYSFVQACNADDANALHTIQFKMEQIERKIEALQSRDTYLTDLIARQQNTISELHKTVSKHQMTINQLQTTLKRQQKTINRYDNKMSNIQQREQQDEVVTALKLSVNQRHPIRFLPDKMLTPEKKQNLSMTTQQNINKAIQMQPVPQKKSTVVQRGNTKLDYKPENIRKRLVLNSESHIAFTVSLTKTIDSVGFNKNIPFDNVILNLGNGYHVQNGQFIVPQSGLYVFSASLLFDSKGQDTAHAYLTRNGNNMAGLYAHGQSGEWDHSSQTVFLQVTQGDEVTVRSVDYMNTSVFGNSYSSFSGYLLYAS